MPILLFIVGLLFGSYATMLIYRIYEQKPGKMGGRSACPHCDATLQPHDLIPLFSYLSTKGKCRYCSEKISPIYPAIETSMGLAFAIFGGYFWHMIGPNIWQEWVFFLLLLAAIFVTVLYVFYDILYTEIPDPVMIPAINITLIVLLLSYQSAIFGYFYPFADWPKLFEGIMAALVLYGFFYLQILIPAGWHFFVKKQFTHIWKLLVQGLLFPIWIVLRLFVSEKKADSILPDIPSKNVPVWIGGGDLRIALFIGLVGGLKVGIFSLLLAYFLGAIFAFFMILLKDKKRIYVPFGPFLGLGFLLSFILYGPVVQDWYLKFLF